MASSFSSSRIVYASDDDELPAIFVKLPRRQGTAVVLVANNCPALHSRENLALLQRQAVDLELDLTFVCGNRGVRDIASGFGIKAVSSLGAIHPSAHSEAAAEAATGIKSGADKKRSAEAFAAQSAQPEYSSPRTASSSRDARSGKAARLRSESRGGAGKGEPTASLRTRGSGRQPTEGKSRAPLTVDRTFSTVLALATLVVVVLFILWGVVYMVVPSAEVTLMPVQRRYTTVLQLMADPQTNRLDASAGKIPAQRIVIEESEELTVAATGTKEVPVGRAEGTVIFRNQISQPVVVRRGTVVMTNDNRRFKTSVEVTVPPTSGASDSFGAKRVAVVSDELGPIGNVDSGGISHIEDQSLNQRLTVINDLPIHGGRLNIVDFVTEEDRLQLFDTLRQKLKQRVLYRLGERKDASDSIFVQWDDDIIVEQADYDRAAGEDGNEVTLIMKVKWRGTAFSAEYLEEAAPAILQRIVENQLGSFELQEDSLRIATPNVEGISEGVVLLTLQAEVDLVSTWNLGEVRRELANKSRAEAENYLAGLEGVSEFALEMGPDWYDRLPRLWFRIAIEVVEPLQIAA